MTSAPAEYRVASVVLNYNSDADLQVSVPQLCAQQGINHAVIIVDNASTPECVQRTQAWLREEYPDAIIGTVAEVEAWVQSHPRLAQENGRVYLMLNHENRGYSAGNNIGVRLSDALGADAVLIANPDMRITDSNYVAGLANVLISDKRFCIAASRIVGLDGKDQSPLRELSYWEELFWPRYALARWFKWNVSDVLPIISCETRKVTKVSGCCLLLRAEFLRAAGGLDENVFLYCEEPILSAKVQQQQGCIVFVPALSATHAHHKSQKDNASRRMLLFIKSRQYYLRHYGHYGPAGRSLLFASYAILKLLHSIKLLSVKLD